MPTQEQQDQNLPEEVWKDVVGYEGLYLVSNLGRFKCVGRVLRYVDASGLEHLVRRKEKIKAQQTLTNGYRFLALWKDGKSHYVTTHRAVAEAFIPNPKNLRTVNHKNGIRDDNRVDNLEWASYSDNLLHSMYVLGRIHTLGKPIMCVETGEVYRSVRAAAKETGEKEASIRRQVHGKLRSLHGKHWKFINEEKYGRKQHRSSEGV